MAAVLPDEEEQPWQTTKTSARDRDRVSADEDYEVRHFANKVGLTIQQVRDLIQQRGNDRSTLEREAEKLRG
ncbi:DUF3606 domain-containing protein [Mesorhizobium sp. BH1-1-5]|uniref:DUF3606 domain-containing protein n=1 Tax=Mesorhizobium sp. BH1-1-5 TaxID=2876661 RepID=UPI001CD02079|nr:DUF3606 domain-containing protein [Mesorhizobium sp. BH1-1-5]MBZ9990961.1 DUF3606 domain-containing protein [Mesorhizobium sp. BH1-1-5]